MLDFVSLSLQQKEYILSVIGTPKRHTEIVASTGNSCHYLTKKKVHTLADFPRWKHVSFLPLLSQPSKILII